MRADLTPELFEPTPREPTTIDQAAELHRRMPHARSWQEKRALHAAAMELIYRRLGPKPDGSWPRVRR